MEHVRNLLYRRPELYELVYPEPDEQTPRMCREFFDRYLSDEPASILDVGCGTGRDLSVLSRSCADCVGVDVLPEMIEYARSRHPHLRLEVADMRSVRLQRTFDAILCMGSAFMYALTASDVDSALRTFAVHAHKGTLLILDINNAATCLPGGTFQESSEVAVQLPEFTARAVSTYTFDRRRQTMIRRRLWQLARQYLLVDQHGTARRRCSFCHFRKLAMVLSVR